MPPEIRGCNTLFQLECGIVLTVPKADLDKQLFKFLNLKGNPELCGSLRLGRLAQPIFQVY
jgi:hypothetical protein